jgi:hypothetical protein
MKFTYEINHVIQLLHGIQYFAKIIIVEKRIQGTLRPNQRINLNIRKREIIILSNHFTKSKIQYAQRHVKLKKIYYF